MILTDGGTTPLWAPDGGPERSSLTFVLDWFEELKRLVPVPSPCPSNQAPRSVATPSPPRSEELGKTSKIMAGRE